MPGLQAGQLVVLLGDPSEATDQIDPIVCVLAHVDVPTDRLIVELPLASDPEAGSDTGEFVFVLAVQPGDAYYVCAFRIENVQRPQPKAARTRVWLVLRPSGKWQRVDRRLAERVALAAQLVEGRRYPATGGSLRFEGSMLDMSEGGMLLATDHHLQLRDVLEIQLPLDRPLRVRARVLRVQSAKPSERQKWLAGCKFEGLVPDEGARISEYLAKQSSST